MSTETPITVNSNPIPAQAMAALRVILISLGTALTSRGLLTPGDLDLLNVVVPALGTLAVFAWSQWATRKTAKKLAVTAEAAPNSVSVVR